MIRRVALPLLLLFALVVSACSTDSGSKAAPGTTTGTGPGAAPTGPAELTKTLLGVEQAPRYKYSDWAYQVIDRKTGEVLASQAPDRMFDAGSTMKTFAVSAALDEYGTDYVFKTPVYKAGTQNGGTLDGNLVLVATGDLSFGLRKEPNGQLQYESLPQFDHSYATLGIPGAVEPSGDPLSALDELAAAVKAAGITQINGNVVIDDRLFDPIKWPDGLISPMWVNENLIDIQVQPGAAAGQPATIDWRPKTASYTVETQATTVDSKEKTELKVVETSPGKIVVQGKIAAGQPTLVVQEINDPSAFARTAFIEALQRAGVTVTATPTGSNPASLLPAKGSYQDSAKLGEHTSANLAAYVKLIMKVSYNRGADLMTCLAAVKSGSTNCEDGLTTEVKTATALGVDKTSMFPKDGAGSNDQSRVTATALTTMYKATTGTPYGQALFDSLPIMGKDGTLATSQVNSPAVGKIQMKTGNRAVGNEANQLLLLGNSLAGYIEAKSGRQLVFFVGVSNVPLSSETEFEQVTNDQAGMAVAIQQAY